MLKSCGHIVGAATIAPRRTIASFNAPTDSSDARASGRGFSAEIKWFQRRTGLILPPALRAFFKGTNALPATQTPVRLLRSAESKRLLDNWPRFGFPAAPGYVPIAEDPAGDLFCLATRGPTCGQVFLLAWSGADYPAYPSLEGFLTALTPA